MLYRVARDLDRVLATLLGVNRHVNLFGQHLKLLDSGRTVNVACHQQRAFPFFALELFCKLA